MSKIFKNLHCLFLFVFFVPTILWAGTVQLPQTGQKTCWDESGNVISCAGTGQDGEFQKGIVWPTPRFTVVDACMQDNLTGLMWPKDVTPMNKMTTWQEALDYVKFINVTDGLCGYKDWRLPNILELTSLQNQSETYLIDWLKAQGFLDFSGLMGDGYWTSSDDINQPGTYARVVGLQGGGQAQLDKYENLLSMPVRNGYSGVIQLHKTGWTNCSDSDGHAVVCMGTGQDGELQAGVSCPNPRFSDNEDGTVRDNMTDLLWLKDVIKNDSSGQMNGPAACHPETNKTLQEALDYVKCLNTEKYLGYNDWRLPNSNELLSLVDFARKYPSLPDGHPFDTVKLAKWGPHGVSYWTSTTLALNPWIGLYVSMDYGVLTTWAETKKTPMSVWPVRSGATDPYGYVFISKIGVGTGRVMSTPVGIDCGASCIMTSTSNATVTLSATADPGFLFTGWSGGGCSGNGNCTIAMDEARNITATFNTPTYAITSTAGDHGTIIPSGAIPVNGGNSQTFAITPDRYALDRVTTNGVLTNECYLVSDVLVDGASVGAVTSYTFNNVKADHTISATFAEAAPSTSAVVYDDFGSSQINTSLWSVNDPNNFFTQANGYLRIESSADSTSYGLTAKQTLKGDFDIVLPYKDYQAASALVPTNNSLFELFLIWPDGRMEILVTDYTGSITFGSNCVVNGSYLNNRLGNISPAGAMNGWLRVIRTGSTIRAYYRTDADWIMMGDYADAYTGEVTWQIRVYTGGNGIKIASDGVYFPMAGALYASFTGYGLYQYKDNSWSPINSVNPDKMTASGGVLYADFANYGLYKYAGGTWIQINTVHPTNMLSSDGKLYATFAGYGFYQYDNATGWKLINSVNPESMTVSGGILYPVFQNYGFYKYDGTTWTQINSVIPAKVVAGE